MSSTCYKPVNIYSWCPEVKVMQYWTGEKKECNQTRIHKRSEESKPRVFPFTNHKSRNIQEWRPTHSVPCQRLFLTVEKIKNRKHSVSVEQQISSTTCSSGLRYQCDSNCSSFFLGHHRDRWLFIALHPFPPITDTVSKAHSERPSSCLS